ncbi:MAG: hypothetical protein H8K07_18095 [Nitrospira sp.]|nr:hypothetical protein [Nitrospira sp.]
MASRYGSRSVFDKNNAALSTLLRLIQPLGMAFRTAGRWFTGCKHVSTVGSRVDSDKEIKRTMRRGANGHDNGPDSAVERWRLRASDEKPSKMGRWYGRGREGHAEETGIQAFRTFWIPA